MIPQFFVDDVTPFIPNGIVCFWKAEHPNGIFCNWAPTPFVVNGVKYRTSEHYMMAEKARLMGDNESREKILKCRTPKSAMKLGRSITPWNEQLWLERRCEIMYQGCLAKFGSTPELTAQIVATERQVLVEASPLDRIWGVGVGATKAHDPKEWKGLNLLGRVLMQVRESLAPKAALEALTATADKNEKNLKNE